ncbi:MAG: CinA family protein [Anaerofustis stercorihominis]|nr:CinA family protein [Anaerofustis stercorihominis]
MRAKYLIELLTKNNLHISSAESLTGGLFSKTLTDIPGSSAAVNGCIVSYINDVKMNVLGVKKETIEKYTEVSKECAEEMARGAAKLFKSEIAVSFTGYAGPGGGTDKNPVGSAYICIFFKGKTKIFANIYNGDRNSVREQCVNTAIKELISLTEQL